MSDPIKHECGIALLRLKRPLSYFQEQYGSWRWGLEKMYLLMEKQHNRGQDGAGLASIKLDLPPGYQYIDRVRSNSSTPIKSVFSQVHAPFLTTSPERLNDAEWAKQNLPFAAELYMGHLRYGTFGNDSIEYVHPQIRENNWKSRTLVLAGNFNLTNTTELFNLLISLGQHPKALSDTITILEKIGHFLDDANQKLFRGYKDQGIANIEISALIAQNLDVAAVLSEATKDFDGGYALEGILGHGDAFVCRDPWGIRPAFYYDCEEYTVVASERPVIQTVFNVQGEEVRPIAPGHALIIKRNGTVQHRQIREPQKLSQCSFERIYFSRGTDASIYRERTALGESLTEPILKSIDYDIDHTVFSFIPNTAEIAFYGMLKGLQHWELEERIQRILALKSHDENSLRDVLRHQLRVEKIAVKDVKLRTFITQDADRQGMVQHVYDITYGTIRPGVDSLVVIDDSIVRGTTLKQSILRILDRLNPKRIVVVSSAPQVRYPDCYGIDMARLEDFIAFRAAISLTQKRGEEYRIQEVYKKCLEENASGKPEVENCVKGIYAPFTPEEIAEEMALILQHKEVRAEVKIIFQTVEALHKACPEHTGDWYFTGNYPTPGGNRVANRAYMNYMEKNSGRAY